MPNLDQLQHWLLASITEPTSNKDIDDHLRPSLRQSAADRLAVYQHAYTARLLEVLQDLFPCTRFAVGDELFTQFAASYLQAHPPHSYTLNHLADQFPGYLDTTRPADWGAFVVELARLEQKIDRIFDAPGPENLPPFTMPAAADASLKLALVSGFELHRFEHPVSDYFTAWKAGREPNWPEPHDQFVALFRRDYIVRRYELTHSQYDLLCSFKSGVSLGDALAAAANNHPAGVEILTRDFHNWFAFWAAERFFA